MTLAFIRIYYVLRAACGIGYPGTRIVGGSEVRENEYPWMASLWNAKRKFFCGGSIVTDQYVLTAAHCLRYLNDLSTMPTN